MRIKLKTTDDFLPPGSTLRSHIIDKIKTLLKTTRQYIDEVIINITGTNKTSNQTENECTVCITIPGQTPVFVTSRGNDIYHTISKATERVARKSRKRLGSRLTKFRKSNRTRIGPLIANYSST